MSTIHEAARRGNLDAVRKFVAADPSSVDADDQHQWRPIFHAALCRHIDVVQFLVQSGADLAAHDGYVLHYGGEVPDNKDVVELLIRYGALDAHVLPPDNLSRQFLAAVFLADEERVRALLALHPRLATAIDGRGDQAIHHAARNGDTGIVRILIENGADVNATGRSSNTVLYCAGGHAHRETVVLLLDHDVDVNANIGPGDQTLLQWLAQFPSDRRFQGITKLLENHRPDAV